ncbi:MAG: hypothetical protein ACLFV7_07860 [Phycisphaerae bacterium]
MRTLTTLAGLTFAMLLLAAGGCATHSDPVVDTAPDTPAERNFRQVWDASEDVLRRAGFQIAYRDRRAGRIVTKETVGKQWWELWRDDAVTARGIAESTVQTIYRTVEVQITPAADGRFSARAVATEHRSNEQQPQLGITAAAYQMFSPGGRSQRWWLVDYGYAGEMNEGADVPPGRVNLGPNAALSNELTERIAARAGSPLPEDAATPAPPAQPE